MKVNESAKSWLTGRAATAVATLAVAAGGYFGFTGDESSDEIASKLAEIRAARVQEQADATAKAVAAVLPKPVDLTPLVSAITDSHKELLEAIRAERHVHKAESKPQRKTVKMQPGTTQDGIAWTDDDGVTWWTHSVSGRLMYSTDKGKTWSYNEQTVTAVMPVQTTYRQQWFRRDGSRSMREHLANFPLHGPDLRRRGINPWSMTEAEAIRFHDRHHNSMQRPSAYRQSSGINVFGFPLIGTGTTVQSSPG